MEDANGDSTNNMGYRMVTTRLRVTQDIRVPCHEVRKVVADVDQAGVLERVPGPSRKNKKGHFTSKGPNFVWSGDGHDKLAGLYGSTFDIHIYGYVCKMKYAILAGAKITIPFLKSVC